MRGMILIPVDLPFLLRKHEAFDLDWSLKICSDRFLSSLQICALSPRSRSCILFLSSFMVSSLANKRKNLDTAGEESTSLSFSRWIVDGAIFRLRAGDISRVALWAIYSSRDPSGSASGHPYYSYLTICQMCINNTVGRIHFSPHSKVERVVHD